MSSYSINSANNVVVSGGRVWINGKKIDPDNLPETQSEKHETKDFNFPANTASLAIGIVSADVSIKSQAGIGVSVHVEGPESLVDQVSVKKVGSEVVIEESGQASTTIVSNGISINSFNGHVSVNSVQTSSDSDNRIKITITKPYSVDVTANMSGMSKLGIDSTSGDFNVDASGMSVVAADSLSGDVDIDASGMAKLKIGEDSSIDSLKVDASGMSAVNVKGKSRTARLKSSGMANVTVSAVERVLSQRSSGMSNISVKRSK